ncbi:MAG: tetratricopeptide repeat protein [Pseudomonadota bacterium]
MPPSPPNPVSTRYFVRRRGGAVSGPHDGPAIAAMLADGRLDGSEDVSTDRQTWKSVRSLAQGGPPATKRAAPAADRSAHLDLDDGGGGISLAPLEIGFSGKNGGPAGTAAVREAGRRDGAGANAAADDGVAIGLDEIDLGAPLELVEHKPARRPERGSPSAQPNPPAAGAPPSREPTAPEARDGGRVATSVASEASAVVAAMLDGEDAIVAEATQPIKLDEKPPALGARPRPGTMTAARRGPASGRAGRRWRPSRRLLLIGGPAVAIGLSAGAAVLLDLPERLRGEPALAAVLGPTGAEIARDRFPSYAEGARLLDEAVIGRRRAPATRAAAAELLASSIVIHGGERGRIARAEVLLDADAAPQGPGRAARLRAQAWIALAKGRWKEAERIAGEPGIAAGDQALLSAWAALGREDAPRAVRLFTAAENAQPPPAPSRVVARYGAAHAQEAALAPTAEAAYRAVLAEAPAHVGAALGLVRVSKLTAAGRLKLAEAIVAKQGEDASRSELAEAHALVARAARELGDAPKAAAALKRAREADPAGVAAAVAAGDAFLAEGRTDEAVTQYKTALAPPVAAPRTPSLKFARVAALLESARSADALAALTELDARLPGDARVSFWRGWAAERERPANLVAADRAYREAIARDPHFLPASLQLARLLLEQRRGADALAVLRNAETRGAPGVPLRIALGQAQLASRNADEAARTFRQLLAADPKNGAANAAASAAAHLGLAGAMEMQGNLEGARAELGALGARGDVPGLGSRVAAILIKLGRREEALATYQKEIAAGGATAATKVAAARVAIDLGRKDVARALAQSAVDDDPRTPGSLLVLAEVWRLDGDLPRAVLELRRALAVDGSSEVQFEYGRALGALGRDEEALAALAQARDIPESGVERGRILLRRGDLEGAARDLAAATARLPAHAEAHLLLGQAEDRLGHVTRAEAAWRIAVKVAPAAPEPRYRLGRLEMDQGRAAAALPNLRAAALHLGARGAPGGAAWMTDLYFQLGFAETRQGSRDRALAAFRRYLELAPADAPARGEVTRQLQALAP